MAGKPDLILLDLGGVLADVGRPASAMRLGMSDQAFWSLWANSPSARDFEIGRIDDSQFLTDFAVELGLRESTEAFRRRFLEWHIPLYPGAHDLLMRLAEHHELALLSNTNPIHWQMVREAGMREELFGQLFLSYEMGRAKPDERIFAEVSDRTGMPPSRIHFFDDSVANVSAARRLGLNAMHVRALEGLTDGLARAGLYPLQS